MSKQLMITGSAARASCGQRRLASVLNSHSSVSACFEVGSYRLCLKASLLSSDDDALVRAVTLGARAGGLPLRLLEPVAQWLGPLQMARAARMASLQPPPIPRRPLWALGMSQLR